VQVLLRYFYDPWRSCLGSERLYYLSRVGVTTNSHARSHYHAAADNRFCEISFFVGITWKKTLLMAKSDWCAFMGYFLGRK
jgi:hypothetical protein